MAVTPPPSGGEGRNRKLVKRILGWLTLQALAEGLRRVAENL
ncbi:hypothetical protein OG333_38495 (plasmid) [Streptomyces anulatus]|nr:hypothetical protein OG333_38495 [Streptomyces anulatus]